MVERDDLQLSGALKNFELCYELAWKPLKKIADTGGKRIAAPRDAFQFGYELGLISNDKIWIEMIKDRNEAVHAYDRSNAEAIFARVKSNYIDEFEQLLNGIEKLHDR